MLAPPQRGPKRPRSPSPPTTFEADDLASPLDMILKRRRRDERHWSDVHNQTTEQSPFLLSPGQSHDHHDYFASHHGDEGDDHPPNGSGESSAAAQRRAMAGIERRRARQWERLNAPVSASAPTATQQHHATYRSGSGSGSQPTPSPSPYPYPSPIPHRQAYSQPDPYTHHGGGQMSSSPIRNLPPSSSPFRDKGGPSSGGDEWTMDHEEMRREWGEEYAAQNSLLHSLHLARLNTQPPTYSQSTDSSQSTQTVYSTPTLTSPHPYRQYTYPDSSPFNPHVHAHAHAHPQSDGMTDERGGDDMMEVLEDEVEVEDEVKRRYEETNRLLGELEVVRRRRLGEGGSDY
ncbi:hypothetical protein CI109_106847 [Kwoniella shandongensis]|uniref:Uncharacterized protein n=1 Tax=Kwoniella shandongensis TaxID=1734106 RepID=A0A5M6C6G1_9TREE|nr:uncharacterized protein CI109_000897 [Kwoniella shandongensis]KAA5530717.1 hypothetical protein CI109_000897 [Kwoniella shandongensis]